MWNNRLKHELLILCVLVIGVAQASMLRVDTPSNTIVVTHKVKQKVINNVPIYIPVVLKKYDQRQIACMTTNAYYEARNQPTKAAIAIADVVMNRVRASQFPTSECKVVYQRIGNVCQFSWVCAPHKPITNWILYGKLYYICENVYVGNIVDLSRDALYYKSTKIHPEFFKGLVKTVVIGDNVFYKQH
jgi:spore germination cell wall hydrolase CwlJ-like protein